MRRGLLLSLVIAALGCTETAGAEVETPDARSATDAWALERDASVDLADAWSPGPVDSGTSRGVVDAARDRLLASYLAYLVAHPDQTQTNGLRGRDLTGVCDLWSRLQPSARAVFLTITARLGGSVLGSDGSRAIEHVTTLYRVVGGGGATATDPGACGGAGNRMFMSMDGVLQAAFVAANDHRGAIGPSGAYDVADVITTSFWRDSHDVAGPHAPFTASDETQGGAPRGQLHFFRATTSAPATSPLGSPDLEALVDPNVFEIDQDYDCVHASNPLCDYIFYGPACLPAASMSGVALYSGTYGAIDLAWLPIGCP